ncbi:hypothetical protein ULG90_22300 [Halopseudomonas pachastrellae]|nr:hypothetical protein ULG90_22300 [Halopseudomonas pachastrellae]
MLLVEVPEPGLESAMPGFILLQDILRAVQLRIARRCSATFAGR